MCIKQRKIVFVFPYKRQVHPESDVHRKKDSLKGHVIKRNEDLEELLDSVMH